MGSLSLAFRPVCVVFGATGHVGQALIPELVRASERVQGRVVAHMRPEGAEREAHRQRFLEQGAEVLELGWEDDQLAARLVELAPTHLFMLVGTTAQRAQEERVDGDPYARIDLARVEDLLQLAHGHESAPRVVYLSSYGAGPKARSAYLRARWQAEEAVRTSGLPFTLCRAGLIAGPDRVESRPSERVTAAIVRPFAWLLRAFGAKRWGARLAPFAARELAYGLVHAGFNYTTLGRTLMPEELRYSLANDDEWNGPATRREDPRY